MTDFRLAGGNLTLPSSSVGNEQVKTPSGSEVPIAVAKVKHLHKIGTNFDKAIGEVPATREEIVFVVTGSNASLRGVHATMDDTGTTGSVDIDLKVNGTTVLSSTFSIGSTDADRATVDGAISSASLSVGDVVSISATISSPDGTGLFAWVEIEEEAA